MLMHCMHELLEAIWHAWLPVHEQAQQGAQQHLSLKKQLLLALLALCLSMLTV